MVGLSAPIKEPTVGVKFVSAGVAACVADMITFPLDVAKVRLQIQGEGISAANSAMASKRGMFGMLVNIVQKEGPKSLYNGLCAGLQRQMCFASVRIGLYDSVKNQYSALASGNVPAGHVGIRILAGITTGGMSVIFAQPTDVVKVRMQAQVTGVAPRYVGTMSAYKTIAVEEGMKGLWKGTLPNVTRNAIVNAAELVCYDLIKEFILRKQLMTDNVPCHFTSAFAAGFCATVVASPVDVVKTRFMNSHHGQYAGAVDCAIKMFKEGGLTSFYKGFMPSFIRLGSWNICMFVTFEQLKRFFTHVSQNGRVISPVPKVYAETPAKIENHVVSLERQHYHFNPVVISQWE
ncbi:dicarboxylate carrier UCP2 [Parasteatoda tepidariorum]|uniref:dicarboxylate carrier UCP2 n=1 Tax=Parasteatoda tepidariorum TaxID=114398 RepID=UPI00077FA169|nr:mitochondrial uncoupling protein 2 [Parasteatoda tepidariorum]XP_015924993.1 mitochondrial uncoupling protein 2 [Parasteatoda tepidariorum]XP_042899328.1 mitochondrial uncoupling protein 2 [Parasteatoda tepidariorum]